MSPVGGVGINYAIQDAVVTSNFLLAGRIRAGDIDEGDLAQVQRARELPTRIIQAIQALIQEKIVGKALDPSASFKPPPFLKFPPIARLLSRIVAYGPRRVRVKLDHDTLSAERVPGSAGTVAVS